MSWDEKNTSPLLLSFTISSLPSFSIKLSRFGIWYLFSNIAFLSDLASNAVLTLRSFLTLMTTGWINLSSVILSTRLICPAVRKFFISTSTAICSCSGTLSFLLCYFCPFFEFDFYRVSLDLTLSVKDLRELLSNFFSALVTFLLYFQFYLQYWYNHLLCLLPLLYSLVASTNRVTH